MNIDINRVDSLHARIKELMVRATTVIANAQKQRPPFDSLSDSERLFCGFIAHEAKQILAAAATKAGLKQESTEQSEVESFFHSAGQFLGTHPEMVEAAYLNGAELLTDTAAELIDRAERVLNGQGSISSKQD